MEIPRGKGERLEWRYSVLRMVHANYTRLLSVLYALIIARVKLVDFRREEGRGRKLYDVYMLDAVMFSGVLHEGQVSA